MTRILRLSLIALVLCALGNPAFAIFCKGCNEQGICDHIPDSGTRCVQQIDFCQEFAANCSGLAEQSTLADQMTLASVEVTTPNGVTRTDAAPRVAELKPLAKLATVPSTR